MTRTYSHRGRLVLGLATAAMAATKGEFGNMCAESLALGKDTPTDCSVNATIKGKTYCFGNEEAKATFMKDPEGNLAKAQSYLPKQASGLSLGVRKGTHW
jgi:YHS domain-containing protein